MKILVLLILLSSIVAAEEMLPEPKEVNQCLEPQAAKENEALVRDHPKDRVLVRLAAIRVGLCNFVDKGIIDVRTATKIFEVEQVKSVRDRWQEKLESSEDITL